MNIVTTYPICLWQIEILKIFANNIKHVSNKCTHCCNLKIVDCYFIMNQELSLCIKIWFVRFESSPVYSLSAGWVWPFCTSQESDAPLQPIWRLPVGSDAHHCHWSHMSIGRSQLNYTERQKKLITSSGRRSLNSTLLKFIIFKHK